MCSGTPHALTKNEKEGYIIVFDDITELIQGQKNAAWSEMARRLAHEIKNPLTPIQLAAERLRACSIFFVISLKEATRNPSSSLLATGICVW